MQHVLAQHQTVPGEAPAPDFQRLALPVPGTACIASPDYHIWCGTMTATPDGLCHVLFSRWRRGWGFNGWATHSEVTYAVGPTSAGPFEVKHPALPARGGDYWDGDVTHNPCVLKIRDKFYLYYTGNCGNGHWRAEADPRKVEVNGDWWSHRNAQRVGVAVADHPAGPWTRFDQPLIDVEPGHFITAVPVISERLDGRFMLVYKTVTPGEPPFGGNVRHRMAVADSPLGPFKTLDMPFPVEARTQFPLDDHMEWCQDGRYYAIVKDCQEKFVPYQDEMVLLQSPDAVHWELAAQPLVMPGRVIRWADGRSQSFKRLEMPKVYLENGKPKVLLLAALDTSVQVAEGEWLERFDGAEHSCNIQVPLATV